MRYYISRANEREITKDLNRNLDLEKKNNIDNEECCKIFKDNCYRSKIELNKKIKKFIDKGKKICGYGATSKSTTILNFCEIGPNIIEFISDTTPDKIGKYSPGQHIPIVSIEHFKNNFIDNTFLFAWNHKEEILKKESDYIANGGNFFDHLL